jgi:hypothetical protein
MLQNERMKVALEYALLTVLRFSPVSIIPPILKKEFSPFLLQEKNDEKFKSG